MPLRLRLAAGRDLDQVGVVFQYVIWNSDDRAAAAFAGPRAELDLAQVLEREIPNDADTFASLPFLVKIAVDEVFKRAVRLRRADHVILFLPKHRLFTLSWRGVARSLKFWRKRPPANS